MYDWSRATVGRMGDSVVLGAGVVALTGPHSRLLVLTGVVDSKAGRPSSGELVNGRAGKDLMPPHWREESLGKSWKEGENGGRGWGNPRGGWSQQVDLADEKELRGLARRKSCGGKWLGRDMKNGEQGA